MACGLRRPGLKPLAKLAFERVGAPCGGCLGEPVHLSQQFSDSLLGVLLAGAEALDGGSGI